MRVAKMNWRQVEARLADDDRAVLPLGSVEQHAYLSLATDAILAERVAREAAAPLGIPVFPVVSYGLAPYFTAWPGTVTLRPATYAALVHDVLASLVGAGFRRIVLVNGHGGNSRVADDVAAELTGAGPAEIRLHDWWRAPETMAAVRAVDPDASHASWMENFPWTRLPGVEVPDRHKAPVALDDAVRADPDAMRARLGDGSFGGWYARSAEVMADIWRIAVRETRAVLAWPP
jgi:creatinine amidohydrolase